MDVDELLAKAARGDEGGLVTLLERFGPEVRRRLSGKIAARWQAVLDVDDVMQVTYVEAFLRIRDFKPAGERAFVGWLARIAENNLRDAVKELGRAKRPQPDRRIQKVAFQESCRSLVVLLSGNDPTPSRHVRQDEVHGILLDALKHLPRDYEAVVRAYDLEQRSAAEIAVEMGRSEGAVYMLRTRAHQQLRGILGRESLFFSDAP